MHDEELDLLIAEYAGELPKKATEFESLLAAGDFERLARAAHQLSGSAGGYGFEVIGDEARRVENLIKKDDPESVLQDVRLAVHRLGELCRSAVPPENPGI